MILQKTDSKIFETARMISKESKKNAAARGILDARDEALVWHSMAVAAREIVSLCEINESDAQDRAQAKKRDKLWYDGVLYDKKPLSAGGGV